MKRSTIVVFMSVMILSASAFANIGKSLSTGDGTTTTETVEEDGFGSAFAQPKTLTLVICDQDDEGICAQEEDAERLWNEARTVVVTADEAAAMFQSYESFVQALNTLGDDSQLANVTDKYGYGDKSASKSATTPPAGEELNTIGDDAQLTNSTEVVVIIPASVIDNQGISSWEELVGVVTSNDYWYRDPQPGPTGVTISEDIYDSVIAGEINGYLQEVKFPTLTCLDPGGCISMVIVIDLDNSVKDDAVDGFLKNDKFQDSAGIGTSAGGPTSFLKDDKF